MIINLSAVAIERAVRLALADAQIDAAAIDAVVSASNGYAAYDRAETAALSNVFSTPKPRALTKRAFGETLGAGGAFALGTAFVALNHRKPPSGARSGRVADEREALARPLGGLLRKRHRGRRRARGLTRSAIRAALFLLHLDDLVHKLLAVASSSLAALTVESARVSAPSLTLTPLL